MRSGLWNASGMHTFQDFIEWAGGTRKAARLLAASASKVSRIKTGVQPLDVNLARECERASEGRYRAVDLLGLTTDKAA